jgi:hypothetical protein
MCKLPIINLFLIGIVTSCALQKPDRRFDVTVAEPTFTSAFPKVFYDEAHLNTHKATGTYKPFIDLITNDGYRVSVNKEVFSFESLDKYDLLVICNAKSDKDLPRQRWCLYNRGM